MDSKKDSVAISDSAKMSEDCYDSWPSCELGCLLTSSRHQLSNAKTLARCRRIIVHFITPSAIFTSRNLCCATVLIALA